MVVNNANRKFFQQEKKPLVCIDAFDLTSSHDKIRYTIILLHVNLVWFDLYGSIQLCRNHLSSALAILVFYRNLLARRIFDFESFVQSSQTNSSFDDNHQ